jgi:hypothetical protein
MGVGVRKSEAVSGNERFSAPFRIVFNETWKRIGDFRLLIVWELVIWSFVALRFGNDIFGFFTVAFAQVAILCSLAFVFALTPLLVGPWVYRAQVMGPSWIDGAKDLQIDPSRFLSARVASVVWLWFRVFAPFLFLTLYLLVLLPPMIVQPNEFSGILPDLITYGHPPEFMNVRWFNYSDTTVLILFAVQFIGWFTFPPAWAFYWGTRLKRNPVNFFIIYYGYIILLGLAVHMFMNIPSFNLVAMKILSGFPPVVIILAVFGIVASAVLYMGTVSLIRRRVS